MLPPLRPFKDKPKRPASPPRRPTAAKTTTPPTTVRADRLSLAPQKPQAPQLKVIKAH
ncbi:MAG: hypothetical protein AAFO62_00570 [Pseudomonadota bacterium]